MDMIEARAKEIGIDLTLPFLMLAALNVFFYAALALPGFFILRKIVRALSREVRALTAGLAACGGIGA